MLTRLALLCEVFPSYYVNEELVWLSDEELS